MRLTICRVFSSFCLSSVCRLSHTAVSLVRIRVRRSICWLTKSNVPISIPSIRVKPIPIFVLETFFTVYSYILSFYILRRRCKNVTKVRLIIENKK